MTIRILGIRKPVSRFRQRVEVLFSALSILRAKTCRILFVFSLADPFSALSAFQVSTHRSSSFLIPIRKEPNTVTDYNTTLPFSQGTPRFSLRFLPQIANFPRIYCSNSTLLTSFRVPMYKTNGQSCNQSALSRIRSTRHECRKRINNAFRPSLQSH